MSAFHFALLGSLAACAVTTAGIFAVSRFERWANAYSIYFVGFAAGILLAVSILHLIPKSMDMSALAPSWVLAGFMGLFLISQAIDMHDRYGRRSEAGRVGLLFMIGVGLHSFLDGLLYAVTFSVSMLTGTLAAIGMVLHEFPEGVVTYVILNRGMSRRRSFVLAFATAAATTPAGVLAAYPVVRLVGQQGLGNLLALSAGALTYVGASHLLPIVERERKPPVLFALGAGILLIVLILEAAHNGG